MTESTTLISFAVASAALVALPGPATLYIVTRSLDQGRQAGFASVLGISVGAMVHFVAAGLGLSAVLATSVTAFSAVKYAGALYLIYLGIRKLRSDEQWLMAGAIAQKPLLSIFRQGIVVNVLNPKAAMFSLAFLPQFLDPNLGPIWQQLVPLSLIFISIGLIGDGTYSLMAGQMRQWIGRHPLFLRRQKYVTGGIYVALGVMTATVSPSHE